MEASSRATDLIRAARRAQGARSRLRTAARELFRLVAGVRAAVRDRFRGPKHADLRRAFGVGMPASPEKIRTTLELQDKVVAGLAAHPEAAGAIRLHRQTLAAMAKWRQRLEQAQADVRTLTQERTAVRRFHGLVPRKKRAR